MPESVFEEMLGVSIGTMRMVTIIAALCTLSLYIYRLQSVIHCMRRDADDFPSQVDRVVWSLLSAFMPLGIGAYLYDVVSRKNPLQPLFLIPFAGVVCSIIFMLIKVWPRSTSFSFDFLGL